MAARKKGFLEKILTSSFKKDGNQAWGVILKNVPNKQAEANLLRLLTDQLNTSADDAGKILQAVPIILFNNLTSLEAEQFKLRLNETGARTGISNDPEELRGLPLVSWPKKMTAVDLGEMEGSSNIPTPPPFLPPAPAPSSPLPPKSTLPPFSSSSFPKTAPSSPIPPSSSPIGREKPSAPLPVIPSRPATPLPPAHSFPSAPPPPQPVSSVPPGEDWKKKYDFLQKSYMDALGKLERKEAELRSGQERLAGLSQESLERQRERDDASRDRDHLRLQAEISQQETQSLKEQLDSVAQEKEEALEGFRREIQQNAGVRDSFERELVVLRAEKESLKSEVANLLEGIKVDLQLRISELMKPVEPLRSHLHRVETLLGNIQSLGSTPTHSPERSKPQTPRSSAVIPLPPGTKPPSRPEPPTRSPDGGPRLGIIRPPSE